MKNRKVVIEETESGACVTISVKISEFEKKIFGDRVQKFALQWAKQQIENSLSGKGVSSVATNTRLIGNKPVEGTSSDRIAKKLDELDKAGEDFDFVHSSFPAYLKHIIDSPYVSERLKKSAQEMLDAQFGG
jgi:hypothetical protein